MSKKYTWVLGLVLILSLALAACVAPPTGDAPSAAEEPAAEEASDDAAEESSDDAMAMISAPECIAPSNPGGGWDFTCRAVGRVMGEIAAVDGTVKVTNMAGGGGGVAFANVVTERNDDEALFLAASPATTLRIAQQQYGDFTAEDVRWLGVVGADFAVLAVAADSPYETLGDLIAAMEADINSVNFGGGSSVGGQDHMKVLLTAQAAGLDPLAVRYTPFDGGGEALTALLGGFIDVFPGDASEVIGQVEAGDVRILATLSSDRLAAPLDTAPTAAEEGYDVNWIVFRGFYLPGDISDEAYDMWVDALTKVAESPEWAEARAEGGLGEFFMVGDEFESYVLDQVSSFRQLSIDLGIIEE
ncbi:MAG: tripartite tricarboxylate transporter substrate-binding protein [Chloroflexota bacterium]